jgi:hypothetical protein
VTHEQVREGMMQREEWNERRRVNRHDKRESGGGREVQRESKRAVELEYAPQEE